MCGTPVISTDWGAFTETVIQGFNGYRCRYLGEFIRAAEKVKQLDRASIREHAAKNYSLDAIAPRYTAYFRRLETLWDEGVYTTR
jgi:glycosyltransferase involved in cell wall biosynthesis